MRFSHGTGVLSAKFTDSSSHKNMRHRNRAYSFGLQAFRLPLLVPLQLKSERQSDEVSQIFTQLIALPATESQTEASGHWEVSPGVVQALVQ